MNRRRSCFVALFLITAQLFNTSCAPTQDGRNTQIQGTALGAVAGGLLGAALGAATGNRDNVVRFAALGATAGGYAGYRYGTAVAKRKAHYARTEDWLDQETVLARRSNARARSYNASLRQQVASLDRRIAAARASRSTTALRSLKSQADQLSRQAKAQDTQEVQSVNDQKAILGDQSAHKANNFSAYQREANSFSQARAERGQLVSRLASLENSIDR